MKKGITLASLAIYIVLFTTFTIFSSNVSSNMNTKVLSNKGEAINYTKMNKLQYNITESCLESNDVAFTDSNLVFSNSDKYSYDQDKKTIYKNDGILITDVDEYAVNVEEINGVKKVKINYSISSYTDNIIKEIICVVEGINE